MESNSGNRFASQGHTAEDLLKSQTVGLVGLSDFRKRRAEAIEQRELQSGSFGRFAPAGADSAGPSSGTQTPISNDESADRPTIRPKKKKKILGKGKLSFGLDEDDGDGAQESTKSREDDAANGSEKPRTSIKSTFPIHKKTQLGPNASLNAPAPRAVTKSALRSDALTRETLRKSFLSLQEKVRDTSVAIPFVFYDGTNTPGGVCRMKKGEHIWLFLDRARKAGAKLGVSGGANATGGGGTGKAAAAAAKIASNRTRSHWARIGVDDLLFVRGEVIIPHHYEIYYFLANKTLDPNGKLLFDYDNGTDERPGAAARRKLNVEPIASPTDTATEPPAPVAGETKPPTEQAEKQSSYNPLSLYSSHGHGRAADRGKAGSDDEDEEDEDDLEGCEDDPKYTKVVDRRWYERNKHIFPASMWENFDPAKTVDGRVRKDPEGNSYFFS